MIVRRIDTCAASAYSSLYTSASPVWMRVANCIWASSMPIERPRYCRSSSAVRRCMTLRLVFLTASSTSLVGICSAIMMPSPYFGSSKCVRESLGCFLFGLGFVSGT